MIFLFFHSKHFFFQVTPVRDAPGHRQVARHEPDLPGHGPPGADPLDARQALVRGHEFQVTIVQLN